MAALLAGCGATGTPVDPAPISSADRPRPVGVQENPTTGSAAPAQPSCPADGRASFRPGPLPPPGQMPDGSTMRRIFDRGRLVAGVDQNNFRFGFRNPSTNELEGFDIDRVHEIAAAIFGDPNKIQYKVLSSAERIPALEKGEVDIVVRTFTATCERWEKINFSRIYYVAQQRVLVDVSSPATSLDDLGGKKVCAQRGSTSINTLATYRSKPVPVATDTWSDCLVMLQQHQVDAVSTDDVILAGLAAQDPNVKLVGPSIRDEPYGIGVAKPNEDLVRFINGVLEQSVRNGQWAASYALWVGSRTGQTASPPPAQYRD
ncbi:MAG TPA: glutamate ABC transporter substrate-binding protein [Actinophytocola sp.]|uniref:glutamate ABC transporter substrate-binding protein n=1 Tax=Actinophytocola sp. TaxID=1872138 RepID=UPI002DDD276E|nr:glutamate ABC transporter substrate-binding protein [Actinophytocola sp.]HEV2778417.1 glutamate ABC transporter substrate-binding protein [Actinophytocola sp.]